MAATEGGMLVLNRVVAEFVGHGTGAWNEADPLTLV